MPKIAMWLKVDEESVIAALAQAAEKLTGDEGEVLLDCASLRRLDANALRALEDFLRVAEAKSVKVVLRGVKVEVYKVLKLVRLASRLCFVD
jgi:anti-anti-sigma regulatory factor